MAVAYLEFIIRVDPSRWLEWPYRRRSRHYDLARGGFLGWSLFYEPRGIVAWKKFRWYPAVLLNVLWDRTGGS